MMAARAALVAVAGVVGVVVVGLLLPDRTDRSTGPSQESRGFSHDGNNVRVEFLGEIAHSEIFSPDATLPARPVGSDGFPEGVLHIERPIWLKFRYEINGNVREVLVAKEPLMNYVSWDAIARAGAALGDGTQVQLADGGYPQDARVTDLNGHVYRVRFPTCGRSTRADLSEWNLLIGAVHRGDPDFSGERFGWIGSPYADKDLKVGLHGSLSWCRELWRPSATHRVLRGYFFVSRFHAEPSDLATDRIYWRPVLERERPGAPREGIRMEAGGELSPDRRVRYLGTVPNERIFGPEGRITDRVPLPRGIYFDRGRPDWLRFELDGRELYVAARAVRVAISWDVIARGGAALGDGSVVRVGTGAYPQDAEISDIEGTRYRVRLLGCGSATYDHLSEWNLLIGGIHRGDGDFRANRDGRYGWVAEPLTDPDLNIGELPGAATWCRDHQSIDGLRHAVNRGYLTVSRFHLTESGYFDPVFGWRPVLERILSPGAR